MKQYGDITKLNGAKLEPVDLIVGGSPCQDLSIAGQRKGLEGERSGLFMEMIRVIKEMRNATNFIRPRWILWENVPGAFSSNDGRDFSAVLTELCRIAEPGTPDVPMPEEGWPKSGVLLGPDWSIAWRTHDAQFWGVPQRRRRIALVMDLRGQSAPEILFERKGVSGNSEQSAEAQESITGKAQDSTGTTGVSLVRERERERERETSDCDESSTDLDGDADGPCSHTWRGRLQRTADRVISFQERSGKPGGGKGILIQEDHVGALSTVNNQAVFDPSVHHEYREFDDVSETVRSRYGTGGNNQPLVVATMQGFGDYVETDIASSCKQRDYKDATDLVCRIQEDQPYVRRLTPLECERLQGFPDGWTDIPGASDAKRYRALGNSIALPFGLSLPSGLSALVR